MTTALDRLFPWIAIFNLALVAIVLLVFGRLAVARPLTELPEGRQNAAEWALEWFVGQAKQIHPPSVLLIAPFLATVFLLILFSNLLAILPIPILRIPPTAYFSVPLGFAAIAVLGIFLLKARIDGIGAAIRHSFWPNPIQLVADASHVMSLSLRLYGNIAGEYLVAVLAAAAAPYGVPIIIHALGLIPAGVQPIVFTLLTADFLATAAPGAAPVPNTTAGGPPATEAR